MKTLIVAVALLASVSAAHAEECWVNKADHAITIKNDPANTEGRGGVIVTSRTAAFRLYEGSAGTGIDDVRVFFDDDSKGYSLILGKKHDESPQLAKLTGAKSPIFVLGECK